MRFYQRAGQEKDAAHAGAGWTDAAAFVGSLQDHQCRLFNDRDNAGTERDVWGGWFDAGDLNKYTSWTAGHVQTLLRAYAENSTVWTDDYGRLVHKLDAAAGATPATVDAIHGAYPTGTMGSDNLGALAQDPYLAHLPAYVWGSNSIKAHMGNIFASVVTYGLDAPSNAEMIQAAAGYVHYLHGVNPFSLVYLTNMYEYGAENCVDEIFHTWFADGSPSWDRVGTSTYGPPPGFLSGGPNPYYDWDGCCPSSCGDPANAVCTSESISPPKDQPPQKSYKDFNTGWPLGSWSISEPSNGYQVAYIRLLSKFVR